MEFLLLMQELLQCYRIRHGRANIGYCIPRTYNGSKWQPLHHEENNVFVDMIKQAHNEVC
jgi:hypothetical protein